MPLQHIEHFLIQTAEIKATCDWYVNALGMRVGPHPDFKFPVAWLYIGDVDVVHVTVGGKNVSANRKAYLGQQSEATEGSGVVDHIAFRCTGLRDTMANLQKQQVKFHQRMVDDQGLFQLFMLDPNGIKIELNFGNAEAVGIEPDLMAAALPA